MSALERNFGLDIKCRHHYLGVLKKMYINSQYRMDDERIIKYYSDGIEETRLDSEFFRLEGLRTKSIISRFAGSRPMKILDAGGGTGYYAFWLQSLGHQVTLLDLSPDNIARAKEHAARTNEKLSGYVTGNAMDLPFDDNEFDMVLLLGPLYHLVKREDRIEALAEVKRVLKSDCVMIAAVISRYASMMDGIKRNLIRDPRFMQILLGDFESGIHKNETDNPEYFTTSFFHTTAEIKNEISASGLFLERLIGVEGVGWVIDNFQEKSRDPDYLKSLMDILEKVESREDIISASPHILAIARKK